MSITNKHKQLLTIATIAGLSLGGLTATSAVAAQGYGGGEANTSATVETVESVETNSTFQDEAPIIQIQVEESEGETQGENEDRRSRRGHRGGCNLEAAAEAIGIEEADLKAAIDDGATIAEVAEQNGVSADDVVDAMVDAKEERIAEKVAEGRITQEEADEKLADVEARTSDRVNGVEDGDEV